MICDVHPGFGSGFFPHPGSQIRILNTEITYNLVEIVRVADPDSGIRCLFDPWIRDPE